MGEVNLVSQIFDKLSHADLIKCRELLDNAINKSFNTKRKELHSKSSKDYIDYHDNFLAKESVEQ